MKRCLPLPVLLLVLVVLGGCVERRFVIRSDPPGATVWLDGKRAGTTPYIREFVHYGGRSIVVEKNGYKTIKVLEEVNAPFYQIFPFELIAEGLIPWTITDERVFDYTLEPQEPAAPDELLRRAEGFRNEALEETEPED